jgi:hypothetical protein
MADEEPGLLLLAVAERVHAEFPEEQGLVSDEVLEPEQVAAERVPIVKVDVEGREVEE